MGTQREIMHRRSMSPLHSIAQERPYVIHFIHISPVNPHSNTKGKQCYPILQMRQLGPEGPKDTWLIERQNLDSNTGLLTPNPSLGRGSFHGRPCPELSPCGDFHVSNYRL